MRLQGGHVLKDSGGLGSFWAGVRLKQRYGMGVVEPLFTDTMVERADLYRFLIEGAAWLFDLPKPHDLLRDALALPPVTKATIPARKEALSRLRAATRERIPGLTWLADGRTPWEVFRDVRFIGSNRAAVCAKALKRTLADGYIRDRYDLATTTVHVGIDAFEAWRLAELRKAVPNFRWDAPLCWEPHWDKAQMREALPALGIRESVAYMLGETHDNCSGGCVQKGQGGWAKLHRDDPTTFNYNADEESDWQADIGNTTVAVLRDRSLEGRKAEAERRGLPVIPNVAPLTLRQLEARIFAGQEIEHLDVRGCGCMVDYASATED